VAPSPCVLHEACPHLQPHAHPYPYPYPHSCPPICTLTHSCTHTHTYTHTHTRVHAHRRMPRRRPRPRSCLAARAPAGGTAGPSPPGAAGCCPWAGLGGCWLPWSCLGGAAPSRAVPAPPSKGHACRCVRVCVCVCMAPSACKCVWALVQAAGFGWGPYGVKGEGVVSALIDFRCVRYHNPLFCSAPLLVSAQRSAERSGRRPPPARRAEGWCCRGAVGA